MPFSKKTSTFTGSFSQKNSALAKQPSAYKLFFDRRGRYIFVRLAGFSTRFFWGHVAGECQSLPLACHTQTLDLPHPNPSPATPKPLTCHTWSPWPATSKPQTCHAKTLDLPDPNPWPAAPKPLTSHAQSPWPAARGRSHDMCFLILFVLLF